MRKVPSSSLAFCFQPSLNCTVEDCSECAQTQSPPVSLHSLGGYNNGLLGEGKSECFYLDVGRIIGNFHLSIVPVGNLGVNISIFGGGEIGQLVQCNV